MLWTAAAVAAATGGQVRPTEGATGPREPLFASVSIDSRTIGRDGLFVAVRAERDGHDFIPAAVAGGAAGYLVEAGCADAVAARLGEGSSTAVEVADTGLALLDLGRAARDRLHGPVVGITGSVGKTSTKDLLAAALRPRFRVAASERSLNNELGVPLTLANAAGDTEVAVVEMGARGIGHIALLCDVARPTVAVVTAVVAAHTELFGSIEAVAQAKGELVEAVGPTGLAVLNADDPRVAAMAARTAGDVLSYSTTGRAGADVSATDVHVGPDLRASMLLSTPWGSGPVTLAVRGEQQVGNAAAAAAVALHCGVAWEDVVEALARATISPLRMELVTTATGALVLNDAYNANPTSMAAAVRSLAVLPARRRVAVVGPMAELGPAGPDAHREIAALAAALGVDLLAVGTSDYGPPGLAGIDEAVAALGPLGDGDAVLVKASRSAGLERLAARLVAAG